MTNDNAVRRIRPLGLLITGLVCAGLVGGSVSPVWAAEGEGDGQDGSPVVGSFGVGDGLEAAVDERDGSVRFTLAAAGLPLTWDSKGAGGPDRTGFGPAWALGTTHITAHGGVLVTPASGGGPYPTDPTHPSGLAGYGVEDIVFQQSAGTLPARPIAPGAGLPEQPAEIAYAYVLHEIGGLVTYYNEAGDPVARTTALEERTEWLWDDLVPHRLIGIVSPDAVVTTLDWDSEPGAVLVTQGANLPGETDPVTGVVGEVPVWRIELDGGRVAGLVDPLGGRVAIDYADDSGLISGMSGVSGATTEVSWQPYDDGTARASQVRVVDATGHELSVRRWSPGGDGTPSSGWPAYGGEGELFWSGDHGFRYQTEVSDGATRIVSEYNSQHLLVDRRMVVTTSSGEHTLREQAFEYPGTEGGGVGDPESLPGNWSRPTVTAVTKRDQLGATLTEHQTTEYDELGRVRSTTSATGTVTTTEYDPVVPEGGMLPIGLPVRETVTAADGLVKQTSYSLNGARNAIVRTEVDEGRVVAGEAEPDLSRTGLAEFEVEPDGFVTAKRSYPAGDPAAEPVITAWSRQLDLGAGTLTTTETLAAGAPEAATTASVTSLRHGGTITAVGAAGTTARTGHDALGRGVTIVDALGNVTTNRFETAQQDGRNAVIMAAPDGVAVTDVRDALGRTVAVTDNIEHGRVSREHERVVETREYPEPGVVRVTDAWGATTTARKDVFGRVVETEASTGLTELTAYDDVARTVTNGITPTKSLDDAEEIRTHLRDAVARRQTRTGSRADGVEVPKMTSGHDGLGRTTESSNGTLSTAVEYDAFGNASSTTMSPDDVSSVDAMAANRRFDGFGNSLEKTLAAGGESRSSGVRTLDALGRTVTETDQLGRVSSFEYTPDGLQTKVHAGDGQVAETSYDPVTRVPLESIVTSATGARITTGFEHDPVTGLLLGVFDPADRAGTEIRYEYDAHRNPLTVTYPDGNQIGYGYDEHGRRTRTTDIDGNVTTLTHTPEGILISVVQADADGEKLAEVSYEFDDHGRVERLKRGNGVETTYSFTSTSMVAGEVTRGPDGTLQSERGYTYDPRGNLTRRVDTVPADPVTHPGEEQVTTTTAYTYDAFDRLTGSTTHAGGSETAPVMRSIAYDASVSGDLRRVTETTTDPETAAPTESVREFEYTPLGELAALTTSTRTGTEPAGVTTVRQEQAYDAAGNLIVALDGTTYDYDAANRPVLSTAADGSVTTIGYWLDGTRKDVATTDPISGLTHRTTFHWDGAALANETHTSSAAAGIEPSDPALTGTAGYLLGAGRHARVTRDEGGATGIAWYGTDRHGNVTELTDADGSVATRYAYSDYGVQTRTPVGGHPDHERGLGRNPFGYAGEWTDLDGNQYLRARIYLPPQFRFASRDCAELHNLYAYADLNPIMNVDPSGRNSEVDWMSIVNWVTFAIGVATICMGIGAAVSLAQTATIAAVIALRLPAGSAARTAILAVGAPTKWEAATIGAGLGFDLLGTGSAAVQAVQHTWGGVEDDEKMMRNLMYIDIATAIGAGLSGVAAVRAMMKRTDLLNELALRVEVIPPRAGGRSQVIAIDVSDPKPTKFQVVKDLAKRTNREGSDSGGAPQPIVQVIQGSSETSSATSPRNIPYIKRKKFYSENGVPREPTFDELRARMKSTAKIGGLHLTEDDPASHILDRLNVSMKKLKGADQDGAAGVIQVMNVELTSLENAIPQTQLIELLWEDWGSLNMRVLRGKLD